MAELSTIQSALLIAAIGAVAFLYSSVGHGGATGYLAVTALLGLSAAFTRPGALWLNCLVASIAFWRFQAAGHFDWKIFLPLAVASIPMAWLGSQIHFEDRTAALILGFSLAAAGLFLGWDAALRPTPRSAPSPSRSRSAQAVGLVCSRASRALAAVFSSRRSSSFATGLRRKQRAESPRCSSW